MSSTSNTTSYSVLIAGSTDHTSLCAQTLRNNEHFFIAGVITPPPKPVGRKQTLTPSSFANWASERIIPQVTVEKKIDESIQEKISTLCQTVPNTRPDFLLVIDFGYLIPEWLLQLPTIAAVNIHPSLLPRWRGSSPAQFSLLHGEKETAVTIMEMSMGLDTGPILKQIPFEVESTWTQTQYYKKGFELAADALPNVLIDRAENTLIATPQPEISPTPTAKRLRKTDSYISWSDLQTALSGDTPTILSNETSKLLGLAFEATHYSWAETVANATRAFYPWPKLWTIIPTKKGPKRMTIESARCQEKSLHLDLVTVEGINTTQWSSIKTLLES